MQKYRKYVGKYLWKNSTSATLVATTEKKKKKKNANFRNILRSNQAQISFIKRSNDLFVRVTRKFIQELARSSSWQVFE